MIKWPMTKSLPGGNASYCWQSGSILAKRVKAATRWP
jgi:hypothetical protein